MAMKWMMGTAAAALIAASPAFAQTTGSEMNNCLIEEMTNEEFLGLDLNDDSGLTMDEYRECLNEAGLSTDDRTRFETAFGEADANADAILLFAEVEQFGQQQAASGEVGEEGRPQGTITVTQPAADVTVRQPSPDVTVTQGEPEVQVQARAPEVSVETPEPEVAVSQAEPEVSVSQPRPEVSVSQPDAEVSVSQPNPEVSVAAGQPDVDVATAQPRVAVETPNPEVEVEQPELDVNVQQAEPDVAVQQAQPDVNVQRTTAVETDTEMTAATATDTDLDVTAYQIRIDDLVGMDVFNAAGEDIGDVENVVLNPTDETPFVIIEVGGFLGLGAREVAFSYDDLTIADDRVVLNTAMTEDEIKDMPEYDETAYQPLPDTMVVR